MIKKWYLQTWFISLMFSQWYLIIPAIIGIVLLILQSKEDNDNSKKANHNISSLNIENESLQIKIDSLNSNIIQLEEKLNNLGSSEYEQVKANIDSINTEIENSNGKIISLNTIIANQQEQLTVLKSDTEKYNKLIESQTKKISRIKELYKRVEYAINEYLCYSPTLVEIKLPVNDLNEIEQISPNVLMKLHCMDVKDLKKAYNENDKQINKLLNLYSSRYTTKANQAIYQLMILALRAELQNILYNLKFEKLEQSTDSVKNMTTKYLKVAGDGNQSIAGTLTKFIGEIEYLFLNAVKIEYNYYVKKEIIKQEQLAIREQMRQEAEERKALEAERKKIEREEEKYKNELDKLNQQLKVVNDEEMEKLKIRILELQSHLSDVTMKRAEIVKLQNGKAGNVYVISNLGSFGENIFKIGMTRRLNPQERIDELGSASVPFRFDVHSFIFSENAVDLENRLHTFLSVNRVNKVNLRKEFFNISIEDLEKLVTDIEPTAEFCRTMAAEDYRQSISSSEVYSNDLVLDLDDDD